MRRHNREGFTLAEVLVSLALVGIILPTAMAGVSLAMKMEETARYRTEAASLASGKLAELIDTGEWQSAETKGDFGEDWPDYSWQIQVEDWEETGVSEVTLTVSRPLRGKTLAVSLSTLARAEGQ
ncbi:MAG: prepilin-type N-terminal cleavage/methylation domain-containing protein [Planctomycetes bacterium]|nr:prepilin-type N-terminal cleavage/methylation domain-containing protein [Planctomycetota bacterium]